MTDDIQERLNFREVDEHGNAVTAVPDQAAAALGGRPGVNPFIVALWVLDAAILALAVLALVATLDPSIRYASGPMPISFMLLNVMPYCFLASALATTGLLFWHAAQWQKRR